MALRDLFSKITSPIDKAIDDRLSQEVEEKTKIAVKAGLESLDAVAPVIGDLLSGEEVTLTVTHTLTFKLNK